MAIPLQIEGFDGHKIEVVPAGVLTPARLLFDGLPAPKGKKRGENSLTRNDGREVSVIWKHQILDMPKLVIDGKTFDIVKPLAWYEWIWSALPILLVIVGGALGGITGILAFSINASIFRSSLHTLVKFLLTLVVSIASLYVYYAVAALLLSMVKP